MVAIRVPPIVCAGCNSTGALQPTGASPVTGLAATDPDNLSLSNPGETVAMTVDGSLATQWNPGVSQSVYRVVVSTSSGQDVVVGYVTFYTFNDTTHSPTGARVYRDSSKALLLASYSGTMNFQSATVGYQLTLAQPYIGNSLYIEFDKSTQWEASRLASYDSCMLGLIWWRRPS
jgi:hypothetical protein